MAVFPEYRGRRIGTKFLSLAEEHAKEQGCTKLSLIVFEQNAGANRLYERYGCREVAREPVVSHPLLHYSGDALLMVKEIT